MTPIHNFNPPDSGRQAPSEKHLEDYLWEHPEALGVWDVDPYEGEPFYKFKWRQLSLPSGIIDLVGSYFDTSLAIVELKKGPVTANAFAQLMRYMRDFKTMLNRTLSDYYSDRLPEWSQLSRHPIVETNWDETLLQGILIGSGCSDENLMIACEACNIEVFHYTYSGGEYQFTHDLRGRHYLTQSYSRVLDVARDGIQDELNRFIDDRLEYETGINIRQHNREFDATKAAEQYLNDLDGAA